MIAGLALPVRPACIHFRGTELRLISHLTWSTFEKCMPLDAYSYLQGTLRTRIEGHRYSSQLTMEYHPALTFTGT